MTRRTGCGGAPASMVGSLKAHGKGEPMRRMAASVLVFEAFIALFFGLAVAKLHPSDDWAVAVVLGVVCVLLCGMLRFRWAYGAAWVLQACFIAAGVFVTDMYVLGVVFAGLWWAGLHYGAKGEQIKAQRMEAFAQEAAQHEQQAAPDVESEPAAAPETVTSETVTSETVATGGIEAERPTLV